jgi:hypothetical protein
VPVDEHESEQSSRFLRAPGYMDNRIRMRKLDRRSVHTYFETRPLAAKANGAGACTGTAGDTNIMAFPWGNVFEYHIKGTQTIVCPVIGTNGLDVGLDQTDDDGVEVTMGITALSPLAFVVGTDPAFFVRLKFSIADVSGTDDCAVGFRKAEAYQAAIDNYDEGAFLNVISGDIKIETILNNGATTTTDTTDNWADGETHTLEVHVSAAGVVTYKIDGDAPTTTAAFTFDSGEVVVPFFYYLHTTDVAGAIELIEFECGLLEQ